MQALDRVRKLLAVAGPFSGASDQERSTAALCAAELIYKYKFEVIGYETAPPGPGICKAPRKYAVPSGEWVKAKAPYNVPCAHIRCARQLLENESVMMRVEGFGVQYAHLECVC